jgi:hypothetical protein
MSADVFKPLADLCSAAVSAAEAAAAAGDAAAEVPEGKRLDAEDALAAVGRLIDIEHAADAAEREVTTLVLRGPHLAGVTRGVIAERFTSCGVRSSRKGPKASWRKSSVGGNRRHAIPRACGSTRQLAYRCPEAAGPAADDGRRLIKRA